VAQLPVSAGTSVLLGAWCAITFAISWRVLARRL